MASSPYVISNPKGNNRDLAVYYYTPTGARKQIALVRPGESCSPEKHMVFVEERVRPPRLEVTPDGGIAKDTRPGGPPNSGAHKKLAQNKA
jgi:hypothetical protein